MTSLRYFPRGRQPVPEAVDQVKECIGEGPFHQDLLIEYLHEIQDGFGRLSRDHLCALAHLMGLPMARVWETAGFYHHFDLEGRGPLPQGALTLRVCTGPSCTMAGGKELLSDLEKGTDPTQVRVVPAPCMGRCHCAPSVALGQNYQTQARLGAVLKAVADRAVDPVIPSYESFVAYALERQGYQALERCRNGHCTVEGVMDALAKAHLRGLGGAGFPSVRKWETVRAGEGPRYLCVNADEGEPGTFKDGHYLSSRPHQFLEGVLIADWAVEAHTVYIYLRDEYPEVREILNREIRVLEDRGLMPPGKIQLRRGAGAYICGEESAMIESIEGGRGLPRQRPPFVAEKGLFGRPTLVHNVETLFWMSDILRRGGKWFARKGRDKGKGLRSYSVSGRVASPGVKLAPAGTSARELIREYCGGMAPGHRFMAYLPGGASGGILPAALGDLPLDFGSLEPHGCFVGSHALVVFSQADDLLSVCRDLTAFFAAESCGQCTPCRVGCEKALELITRDAWDVDLITALCRTLQDASICGLGQAAPNPILSILRHFPDLVPREVTHG